MNNSENNGEERFAKTVSLTELESFFLPLLAEGKSIAFRPKGKSMEPFLHSDREKIELISLPSGDYQKLDIVFYKRKNGDFVLHRIVGKDDSGYILCGDAQMRKEYGIKAGQILGCVRGFYRGKKWIDCRKNGIYRLSSFLWVYLFSIRKMIHYFFYPLRLFWVMMKKLVKRLSMKKRDGGQ